MADLIDYRKYSRQNQGFKYILVVIDAFSRFAYTAPLKFKTAEDSAKALDSIFANFLHPPTLFSSDKGNELGFQAVIQYSYRIHVETSKSSPLKIPLYEKFWLKNIRCKFSPCPEEQK